MPQVYVTFSRIRRFKKKGLQIGWKNYDYDYLSTTYIFTSTYKNILTYPRNQAVEAERDNPQLRGSLHHQPPH